MHTVRKHDSWREMLTDAYKPMSDDMGRQSITLYPDGRGWTLGVSYAQAESMAPNGWQEVRGEVTPLLDRIVSDIKRETRPTFKRRYGVSGGTKVNVGRLVTGEPKCVVTRKRMEDESPNRIVTILVNTTFASGVKDEQIKRRGVAIAGLVEALTVAQFGVEIWAETTVQKSSLFGGSSDDKWTSLVCIKSLGEHLDLDRLMYAVAHPAYLRRTVFSLMEHEDRQVRSTFGFSSSGSYSRPVECTMAEEVNATMVLDLMRWDDRTGADPEGWIRDKLGEYGLMMD